MEYDIEINITNQQKIMNNLMETDHLQYQAEGQFFIKNNKLYLVYHDFSQGLAGARTIVKIDKCLNRVSLLRGEPAQMTQVFVEGEKVSGKYGNLNLQVQTHSLNLEINGFDGSLEIDYCLYFNGYHTSENKLQVSWCHLK